MVSCLKRRTAKLGAKDRRSLLSFDMLRVYSLGRWVEGNSSTLSNFISGTTWLSISLRRRTGTEYISDVLKDLPGTAVLYEAIMSSEVVFRYEGEMWICMVLR